MAKSQRIFTSSFFVIYATQNVSELMSYALNIYFRSARDGLISMAYVISPYGNIAYALLAYCFNYLFVAYFAISVNRYCVITDSWRKMWHGCRAIVIYAVLALLPTPAIVPRSLSRVIPVEVAPGVYAPVFEQPWVYAAVAMTSLVYLVVTSLLTIAFEARAFFAYRNLGIIKKNKYRHDFHLLVYALTQLFSQATWTAYFTLLCIAATTSNRWLTGTVQSFSPYLTDFTSLSGAICLFMSSKVVRKRYSELYFPFTLAQNEASTNSRLQRL